MRTFIQYDGDGEVIAVLQTEWLPEGLEHPLYLEDETHGVLELSEGDEAARRPGSELGAAFRVDVATRKLVAKSDTKHTKSEPTRPEVTTKVSASEAATTEAGSTKVVTTNAATTRSVTKTATKTPTKTSETKKTGTKKAAATKKGRRSSGSK